MSFQTGNSIPWLLQDRQFSIPTIAVILGRSLTNITTSTPPQNQSVFNRLELSDREFHSLATSGQAIFNPYHNRNPRAIAYLLN
ncbi:hypothetical protein [Anabaenopsis elenkinii]|uniref:Uncharacterized protein n=1 Tax=Anabaenopsis elenkinii CCIBt3563 TaxID=2779889 RepID=A0A7U3NLV5_9CYAN|nr:hypothetical protein [Anabaenopsis elenkinii]QOV21260.1 hypothetical protein IM676_10770 [Anabaenopsis elenkinii CCIBt3563]